jgi:hypothetical protein
MLVVVANNGVWGIVGSDEGFSAVNFQVVKLSDVGCISARSVVSTDGAVFYAAKSGMYIIQPNEVNQITATNITETTIQSFYLGITNNVKQNMTGFFEEDQRRVRWLYADNDIYNTATANSVFNKELVFDLVLGAWYTNSFEASSTQYMSSYIPLPDTFATDITADVSYGGVDTDLVTVNTTDNVVVNVTDRATTADTFFYLSRDGANMSMGGLTDTTFQDWGDTSYDSFLETGYMSEGDSARTKRATYLVTHFNRTETGFEEINGELEALNPSGCLVQAKWSYSEALPTNPLDSGSGQFGKVYNATTGLWEAGGFQAYRFIRNYVPANVNDSFDYGESVITTKNKLRGKGKALRLKFSSDEDKDFQLLGWTMEITGNTRV